MWGINLFWSIKGKCFFFLLNWIKWNRFSLNVDSIICLFFFICLFGFQHYELLKWGTGAAASVNVGAIALNVYWDWHEPLSAHRCCAGWYPNWFGDLLPTLSVKVRWKSALVFFWSSSPESRSEFWMDHCSDHYSQWWKV